MTKVLLVSANREFMPYPVFPLGVAYVESALAEAGCETRVFDVNRHRPEQVGGLLAERIGRFRPNIIGFSIRNIDNLTYPISQSYIGEIRRLIETARSAAPASPIVLGGAGYSLFPLEALRELGGDVGVIGEAEGRMGPLVEALVRKRPLSTVGGIVYRDGGSFVLTRPATPAETEFPEKAPRRTPFDLDFYGTEGGMGNVQTKRGCPFHCSYCTYPLLEGRRFRMRPPEAVADEFARLVELYGLEYLYIVDSYFNYPTAHAESVCRAIIARRLSVPWSCFAHPAHMTPRLAELMRQAGCASVELGTDAGSRTMLESLRKEMSPEQIVAASSACREAGIPFAHYLLLGGPGETDDTLSETFDLMDRCEPTAVIVMCGIRIYPGTPIELRAREEGLVEVGESLLEPKFYISPQVRSTLLERVADEAARRPNWIVPGLEINLSPRLMRWLRERGHKGPMWELLAFRGRRRRGGPSGGRGDSQGASPPSGS